MVQAAYILIVIVFALYALPSAVICGVALSLVEPKLLAKPDKAKQLYRPSLELSNVFLLLGLISLFIFFKNNTNNLTHSVSAYVIIAAVALLIRVSLSVYLFGKSGRLNSKVINWLFLIVSYLLPLSLAAVGIFMVTGLQFWSTGAGWSLLFSGAFGLTATGFSFINRFKEIGARPKLRRLNEILFVVWVLLLGFSFPVTFYHYQPSDLGPALTILSVVIAVSIVSYAFAALNQKKYHELFLYNLLLTFSAPLLIGLNNQPFLVLDNASLSGSYSAHSLSGLIIALLIICILLIAATFYMRFKNAIIKTLGLKQS